MYDGKPFELHQMEKEEQVHVYLMGPISPGLGDK